MSIKQLAKETAIYGVSSILVRLLPFAVLTPYYTRIFDTGEYGIVIEVYTYTALLVVLFTYRMETTFFRFGNKQADLEKAFSTAAFSLLFTTAAFVVLLFSFLPSLTQFILKESQHQDLVMLMISIVAADALVAIPFARLRLEKRPIKFAAIKTVNVLVNITSVFFFLSICPWLIEQGWESLESIYDPANRISYVLWANLIASSVTLLIFLPMYARIQLRFETQLWWKMLRYTAPLIIVAVAGVINQLSGNTMIKELASDDYDFNFQCEGIYGAVAKIAVFMNLYTQAFNYAAEPFFFSNAERADARQQYADVARVFTLVGCIVFLGIWCYLDIIKYFIGADFHTGLEIVPILLMANLFLGLYYNFSVWYKLTDQTRYGGYIAVGGAVITLGLNFILIPNPNIPCYHGPAWSALVCYCFMALAAYWLGRKKYPVPYNITKMLFYLALAVGLFAASYYFRSNISNTLIATGINTLLLLVYVFIIFRTDKPFLLQLLKNE